MRLHFPLFAILAFALAWAPAWAQAPIYVGPAPNGSIQVLATGSTTQRALSDRFAETINVKNYGAKGDCVTDDSGAFNAAFAYIRSIAYSVGGNTGYVRLDVPTACYVIANSINATQLRNFNTIWEFHGSTLWGQTTSAPVVDALGSRFFTVRDLTIYGDPTNTPNIGFQHGITQNSPFTAADNNAIEHLSTYGAFTLAGYYNRNAEQSVLLQPVIRNTYAASGAYGAIFDGMNHFNVTSAFVTTTYPQNTSASFLNDTVINGDIRETGGGHAAFLGDTNGHRWIDTYLNSSGVSTYDVASNAVSAGGSGYTTATVTYPAGCTVTPLATATVVSGAVTAIVVTDPGYGCSNSLGAPTIAGGGTGATASAPVMQQDGESPIVLYSGTTGFSDMSFDVHTEGSGSRNVFEIESSVTTTPVLNGFTYRDQNPFNSGSVFTADSPITGVTINALTIPFEGNPKWSGFTFFNNPSEWSVNGNASFEAPAMWNGPGTANMFMTVPLSDNVTVGSGNYVITSASGNGTVLKGNFLQLGSTSTTGVVSTLANAGTIQSTFSNGLWQPKRSTEDAGMRVGHGVSTSWVVSVVEDGNSGVSIATGGTTSGGTQAADFDSHQNAVLGAGSLGTTATNGFVYIPSTTGTPTGTPTTKTGFSPMLFDATNNHLWIWNGSTWQSH